MIETVTLGNTMRIVEVSSPSSFPMGCSVYTNDPVGPWIVDDFELEFQQPPVAVPELSPIGAVVAAVIIATIGVAIIRRWSSVL